METRTSAPAFKTIYQTLPKAHECAFSLTDFRRDPILNNTGVLLHFRPEFDLIYSADGNGIRYIGSSIEPFHKGNLCLIGAGLPHGYQTKFHTPIVVHFLPEAYGQAFWKLPDVQALASLFERAKLGLAFSEKTSAKAGRRLDMMSKMKPASIEAFVAFLGLLQLLAEAPDTRTLNSRAFGENHLRQKNDPRLEKMLQWIDQNAHREIAQADAARLAGMSPPAFSRWFKLRIRQTFIDYVHEVRLARVKLQLAVSEDSITKIALAAGFNHLGNFNEIFRKWTGMTPREYRRQIAVCEKDCD